MTPLPEKYYPRHSQSPRLSARRHSNTTSARPTQHFRDLAIFRLRAALCSTLKQTFLILARKSTDTLSLKAMFMREFNAEVAA
jgi:hypothetical protein